MDLRQFVGFISYYRRFIQDFTVLSELLVALVWKGVLFVWTDRQQMAFDALKTCLINAPILGFPTEDGQFILDTDASLFAMGWGGGVLNQLQEDREVVIAYTSRGLRLSQRRYCTTRREMLAVVVMCTHFRSYLRGAQFTLCTDHSSLRWLQKFQNSDGMLARWYMLLGQFSVTFEYRPGAQHANADGMCRQCGQCMKSGCPVSSPDSRVDNMDSTTALLDQPFTSSEMGDSMDADLLRELSGETWVAATYMDELTADLLTTGSDLDLGMASRQDVTLTTVRKWVQSGAAPAWSKCVGLSPELWHRRAPPAMSSQLVVPAREHQDKIRQFHDSLFAGHLGVSRTTYHLLDRDYWPGLRQDVRSYLASCAVCLARKSPCPRRAPMGHVEVGHRWDRVAMDLLDMSVTTPKGNRHVLVIVDCFSRWSDACPLPNKMALAVADAFFQQIVCRFGMPSAIHSDQGREFENNLMQELCLLCGDLDNFLPPGE